MPINRKQSAALARLIETEGNAKRTQALASGALVVYFADRTAVVIERDGTVTK